MQPLLYLAVAVQIVVADHRSGGIDQPRIRHRALEQLFGRARQAKRPAFQHRPVRRQRPGHANRLDRAFDREAGEVNRVVAVLAQDGAGAILAVGLEHLPLVFRHRRILRVDRELHSRVRVAVLVDPHAHPVEEVVVVHEGRKLLHHHRRGPVVALLLPKPLGDTRRGLVRHHRVHGVIEVLHEHLPVAIVVIAQHAAGDLQPSLRRAVGHIVDGAQRIAEILAKIRALVAQAREHETAVVFHVGYLRQSLPVGRIGNVRFPVAALQRNGPQAAVEAIGPAVVRTPQRASAISFDRTDHPSALVRAAVQENANFPVAAPQHDQRRAGDFRGIEVARLRNLTVVTHVDPSVAPQALKFQPVEFLGDIQVAMHGVGPDQGTQGLRIACVVLTVHR